MPSPQRTLLLIANTGYPLILPIGNNRKSTWQSTWIAWSLIYRPIDKKAVKIPATLIKET
jgi:hypothetical protein